MTVHRFYAAQLPAPGSDLRLSPAEGRHLTRVLRLRSGTRVLVFDGRGRQHEATVTDDDPRRPMLLLGAPVAAAAEPRVRVTLGMTILKGRKLDAVVRDATTLGVTGIVPLLSQRTQPGGEERAGGRLGDRWRGIAVASAKQCGRAVVPEIHPTATFRRFLGHARSHAVRLLLVEPAAAGSAAGGRDGRAPERLAPGGRGARDWSGRRLDGRRDPRRRGGRLPASDPRPTHAALGDRSGRRPRDPAVRLGRPLSPGAPEPQAILATTACCSEGRR